MRTNTQATYLPAATKMPVSSWSSYAAAPQGPSLAFDVMSRGTVTPTVFVVENERAAGEIVCDILEGNGYAVHSFANGAALLRGYRPVHAGCLLVDAVLPGMSGVELVGRVKAIDPAVPAIIMDGNATLVTAIMAMRAGAVDVVEKPISPEQLLESIKRVFSKAKRMEPGTRGITQHISPAYDLTQRQGQILELVLDGWPSKNIAADLGISQRTVENHRAAIMKKTGSRSIPGLIRATLAVV